MRQKLSIFLMSAVIFAAVSVYAQEKSDMMTVEEAYLNSIEGVVIKEMITTDGRDAKLVALQYIENAIESGRMNPDIQAALNSLATIGLTTIIREDGRNMSNFPDIRMKAAELLGRVPTTESKDTLVRVMYIDTEPSVISAAVKSLAEIGINDNDEVIEMINWTARKFDIINPTSSLAFEILGAYEKLAPLAENKKGVVENIMRIAVNHNYVTPVRNRAHEVLMNISGSDQEKKK